MYGGKDVEIRRIVDIDGEIKNEKTIENSILRNDVCNDINIHRFMWGRQFSKNSLMYLERNRSVNNQKFQN